MSSQAPDPSVVAEWMLSARSDLAYAEMPPPEGARYEQGCFHAQQAAEKALKALLLSRDQEPPYVHNIQALLDLLSRGGFVVEQVQEAAALTGYAVLTRYRPLGETVTEDEWLAAADLARQVVRWVEQHLSPEP
jgi:HEPN domain-containing protein